VNTKPESKGESFVSEIVVIEDNLSSARLVAKILQHAGHDVIVAEDGEMGLTTIAEAQPDLILVDLGLPDMDGQTVVALLRQESALNAVPIIAFTAWPQATAYQMAEAYGCDGVITKPIDTHTFADQIATYLEKAEAAQ
jgi:two-component system, cell cycle response regulator DivK